MKMVGDRSELLIYVEMFRNLELGIEDSPEAGREADGLHWRFGGQNVTAQPWHIELALRRFLGFRREHEYPILLLRSLPCHIGLRRGCKCPDPS